jgi:hypothetical protein
LANAFSRDWAAGAACDRELNRQLGNRWAVHLVAKRQLVQHQSVLCFQLAVFELVRHVERELASFDPVTHSVNFRCSDTLGGVAFIDSFIGYRSA